VSEAEGTMLVLRVVFHCRLDLFVTNATADYSNGKQNTQADGACCLTVKSEGYPTCGTKADTCQTRYRLSPAAIMWYN